MWYQGWRVTGVGEVSIVFEFFGGWSLLGCVELGVFDFFELDHVGG